MPQYRMRDVGCFHIGALFGAEADGQRVDGFFQLIHFAGADDGAGDGRLGQQPCQRDLRRSDAALFRDLHDAIDDCKVCVLVVQLMCEFVG